MEGIKYPPLILLVISATLAAYPVIRLIGKKALIADSEKWLIIIIFSCHLSATLFFFTPEDLANNRPVVTLDHAIHYYQVERGDEVFWKTLRLHCYDPYFMAGYPGGAVFDIDSKGVELWCALLNFMGTARAYKLFIFLGYLLFALTMYYGSRRLGFRVEEAVYALLAALVFWHWGRPYAGAFRYAGMFAYMTVSHLSLYVASLFRSFLRGHSIRKFFIIGPLAFFLHPTAAVILPVPLITIFLLERRLFEKRNRKRLTKLSLGFLAWCALVLAVNAIWLVPLLRYLDIKTVSDTFFQVGGLTELAKAVMKPGNIPAIMLLVMAAAGFAALLRDKRFSEALPPAAGSVFLFIISAYGTRIPLFNQMEPGRFLVPALIFAAPLSGPGAASVIRRLKYIIHSDRIRELIKPAAVLVPLVCMPFLSLISAREYYRHTLSTSHTREVSAMIEALKEHTGPAGRLMFEDGLPREYGFCYLSSMIPLYTGVEQIGGPYPHAFIRHNFTNFTAEKTMGSPLSEISPEKMRNYLQLYDIRWILTASSETGSYFSNFPGLETVWSSGRFTLRERAGYGRDIEVEAGYNRIGISIPEPVPLPEQILLEYHWDRSLKVAPPAEIRPQYRLDDPVPFILLEPNGKREIEIISG
ncbi:MAG: hypothetical protein R6U43_04120 [Candidatus Krumholzibacteriales bacterium]